MIDSTNAIKFTDNYEDLSDEHGFRFRFYCDRCDAAYDSVLQPCLRPEESGLLKIVGKLFVEAADDSTELTCDGEDIQHEVALRNAVTEVGEYFHECPSCGEWVCDVCWNRAMLMCEKCAPSGEDQPAGR